ncbi:MAG: SpaA isopeptide-forming pilin-related protein, partial [Actinomycetota bacterium]|nr:SpaA isopeptide-forming pilin-related protein [Actinomycetota bacterium]
GAPLVSVPVAAGAHAVALPTPLPGGVDVATVVLSGPSATTTLGPSAPFSTPPSRAAAPPAGSTPCLGAGYGVGRVSVDGFAGVQGAYCTPPAFTAGTGAYCADHGLDYPAGVAGYGWVPSVAGTATPLTNQYGRAASPADVARLAWIYATWATTTDPARAVAIGVITHAVMGDYPSLGVGDLDPAHVVVVGGDPGAIVTDVGAMWHASGATAGPYAVQIDPGPGPFTVGGHYHGRVVLTGEGGGPEVGVPISLTGPTVTPATAATTGSDGTVGFTWSPTQPAVTLAARTGVPLPGSDVTVWQPATAPVPVQRVLTAGPGVAPATTVNLTANAPATLTLVKQSADPAWVPVGSGFSFDVAQPTGPGGGWVTVASRQTGADGSIAAVTGLQAGTYRVTETAHPPAFQAGGPWTGVVAAGQNARLVLTDQVATRPVLVAKTGDNTAAQPIGAGVTFSVSSDADHRGSFATAEGSWTTGPGGTTTAHDLVPGRYQVAEVAAPPGYRLAPPVTFSVDPVAVAGPIVQTVLVNDLAVRGGLSLRKVDAGTGSGVAGAVLRVATPDQVVGTFTTGRSPIDVPDLLAGRYTVTEVAAPPGYLLPSPAGQTVVLAAGQTLQVTVADQRTASAPSATSPPAPRGTLAFTGLPVWRLVGAGLLLVIAGVAVLALGRRRSPRRR